MTPIPRRLSLPQRMAAAVSAAVGLRIPLVAEDEPMIERARLAWQWSEHHRRLDWLASRHRLRRTVVVAVASTGPGTPSLSSARTSIDLARLLAGIRSDRVAAVDGQPHVQGSRRPGPLLDSTIEELAAGDARALDGIDARFGSPTSGHGVPVVVGPDPARTSAPGSTETRRALDRLRAHAGVIVVDVGRLDGDHPALVTADQVVVVADGLVTADIASTISERPALVIDGGLGLDEEGLGRLVPGVGAITGRDDEERLRRLAIAVVDGWHDVEALVPDPAAYLWE